jgi:hypothetical protein
MLLTLTTINQSTARDEPINLVVSSGYGLSQQLLILQSKCFGIDQKKGVGKEIPHEAKHNLSVILSTGAIDLISSCSCNGKPYQYHNTQLDNNPW